MFTLQRGVQHPSSGALFSAGRVRDLGLDVQEGVEQCNEGSGGKSQVGSWDQILPQQHGQDCTERAPSAGAREIWGELFCEEHQEWE